MGESYWRIFVDPDIPLLERIAKAAVLPIVLPVEAIATALNVSCTALAPDTPLPLPEEGPLPLPSDDIRETAETSPSIDTYLCTPEPCLGGLPHPIRTEPNRRQCLAFDETDVGLASTPPRTGISVAYVNNDTQPDLYVLNAGQPNQLLINNDDGTFTEQSTKHGLAVGGDSRQAAWGDFDTDADPDLFLVGAEGSRLYLNNGAVFTPLPDEFGAVNDEPGTVATFLGVDIFLATENGTRYLQQSAAHHFVPIDPTEIGLADPGQASAVAIADFDGDGATDCFLANATGVNRLFRNLGNNVYASMEDELLAPVPGPSTDAEWVRLPNAALPSLYVANFGAPNQFFVNNGDGTFTERAAEFGLHDPGNTTRARWGDAVGDGNPFLFLGRWDQSNLLYLPQGAPGRPTDQMYLDIAYAMGVSTIGRTVDAAWFDADGDGPLDLVVVMADGALTLHRNGSHWVTTCPEGAE